MDECRLMVRLREKGVRIMVSPDGARVGVGKGQAVLLDDEERRAFRRHRDQIAAHAMFDSALEDLTREAQKRCSPEDADAYEAALDELARAAWDSPLDAALLKADLPALRTALDEILDAVLRTLPSQEEEEEEETPSGATSTETNPDDPQRFYLGDTAAPERDAAAEEAPVLPGF